jgi:hypothetical protein
MSIKLYTANRGSIKQHQEDTKYLQWQDGMYVMLDDLLCDYEMALVENSLRDSAYFVKGYYFDLLPYKMGLGVDKCSAGAWVTGGIFLKLEITRAQALYIATGDTNVLRINES